MRGEQTSTPPSQNNPATTMNINAIVFGATGMVGEGVLFEALRHVNVDSVLVIGRKSCNVSHPKLREVLHHDFFERIIS